MNADEEDHHSIRIKGGQNGLGCFERGCLVSILAPLILLVCPFPETPIRAYPIYGKSDFEVFEHKVILSLGAPEQYEQSRYGMKRGFRIWVDAPNKRSANEQVTITCGKLEYRFNGGEWRNAERLPEGDYRGGGSAGIWFWSPLVEDLEVLDAGRKSYKMRPGKYDLKAEFEAERSSRQTIETTLNLGEKTERHWRSILNILQELSGIT